MTTEANDIGKKQILLNDFLINAAQSANIYYKHKPSKNFLIKELQSNAIKHFSGENTIEKIWESILSDEYYLFDSETPSKASLNNNDIVELSNVILSVWNPLFPGLFYTKYFWNQPEELKKKIKMVDFSFYENEKLIWQNEIFRLSLIKPNPNFAHVDISNAIPVFLNKDDFEFNKDFFFNHLERFGSIYLKKIKILVEQIKVESSQQNPVKDLQLRIIDFTFLIEEDHFEPIQGNLGCMYYHNGILKQISEHFWIGVKDYKENLKKAKARIKEAIPSHSILLLENENFSPLIFENNSTFDPLLDEIKNYISLTKDIKLKAIEHQSISLTTSNPTHLTKNFALGQIIAPLCYDNAICSFDFIKLLISKKICVFFHLRKNNKPKLNFWGYIYITLI